MAVGEISSNRSFAIPAPNCTERIPTSTSQTGEIREVTGSIWVRCRFPAAGGDVLT